MTQEKKFPCSLLDTLEKRTPLQGMEFMGCLYNVGIPGAQLVQEFYSEALIYSPQMMPYFFIIGSNWLAWYNDYEIEPHLRAIKPSL